MITIELTEADAIDLAAALAFDNPRISREIAFQVQQQRVTEPEVTDGKPTLWNTFTKRYPTYGKTR